MENQEVLATDPTAPAVVEVETPVVETPAPEVPAPETPALTVEELTRQLEAEKAKTARAVQNEQAARAKRSEAQAELDRLKAAQDAAEAERLANATLADQLAHFQAQAEAERVKREGIEGEWQNFKLERELEGAGFLTGFEGEAKTAQLTTLKALTGLDLVKEEGQFSITKFAERFAAMRPQVAAPAAPPVETPAPVAPAPTVIDLGGNGTAPAENKGSNFEALKTARAAAFAKGDRMAVIAYDRQLAQLQTK